MNGGIKEAKEAHTAFWRPAVICPLPEDDKRIKIIFYNSEKAPAS